ncbi:MAG: integration host factor subunit alpha [Syntrophobacterales bacterium]|nr:integration host factor subunit alpha [Syntrophobacterales bacterium]
MTVTKAHIVDRLHAELHQVAKVTKNDCARFVETIFELLKGSLAQGEDVLISGFGKFCIRTKNERRGRNPQTGESIILPSRKVVTFKCSGILKKRMNHGR